MAPTRACTRCARVLPLDEEHFYRSRTSKSGFQSRCKACDNDTDAPTTLRRASVKCRECCDIGDRRPAGGCPTCGRPFVAEVLPRASARGGPGAVYPASVTVERGGR